MKESFSEVYLPRGSVSLALKNSQTMSSGLVSTAILFASWTSSTALAVNDGQQKLRGTESSTAFGFNEPKGSGNPFLIYNYYKPYVLFKLILFHDPFKIRLQCYFYSRSHKRSSYHILCTKFLMHSIINSICDSHF